MVKSKKFEAKFVSADEYKPDKKTPKKVLKIKEKYTKRTYKKKLTNFDLYKQYKQDLFPNFSDLEKQIFFNYFEKNLNGLEISEKLSITKSRVYYYTKKIEKLLINLQKNHKNRPHSSKRAKFQPKFQHNSKSNSNSKIAPKSKPKKEIRLHAQQYVIKIKVLSPKYCKLVRRGITQKIVNGEKLMLHKNKIEIYSYKSFWGEIPSQATEESMTYFGKLFTTLEKDLNLTVVKERGENIKQVNNHYALVDCEFAKQYYQLTGHHLRYLDQNGHTRVHTDRSKGKWETETSNPQTAQDDAVSIQGLFDDVFNPEVMNMKQATQSIGQLAEGLNIIANQVSTLVQVQNNAVQMIQAMSPKQQIKEDKEFIPNNSMFM